MEDGSALLLRPARISPTPSLGGSEAGSFQGDVKPVKVVIYRSNDADENGYDCLDRPHHGKHTIHRLVTGCRAHDYGKLPFLATWMLNGHHELSSSVVDARERERKEMQGLNEKFADYIEKVRFLEAQNKSLSKELDEMRQRFGREAKKVKVMFGLELSDARRKFDDLDKTRASLEIKVTSLEEQLAETHKRTRELEDALKEERELTVNAMHRCADLESRCGYLDRKLSDFEAERERDLAKISKLNQQLLKLKSDLDDETLLFVDSENRRRTLEEQINFMKVLHDQEMKELAGLVCRDSTAENREYWRGEMEKAIKEIVQLFEDQMKEFRDDVETSYDWKIREYVGSLNGQNHPNFISDDQRLTQMKDCLKELGDKLMETENKNQILIKEVESLRRLRDGLSSDQGDEINRITLENLRLKSELSSVMEELHSMGDDKLAVERELAAYKKIVEETPGGFTKQVFEHDISTSSEHQSLKHPRKNQSVDLALSEKVAIDSVKGEMSSKIRVQKSSRGNVSIVDCAEDGSHVTLENFGNQDENLNGWYLERTVDDGPPVRFTFIGTTISPGLQIKIWSGNKKRDMLGKGELIFDGGTWTTGSDSTTVLYNCQNEEKATYIQKTKYS